MDLANNPYSKEIFRRTKLSKLENLVTTDCSCKPDNELYNGTKTEYYDNFNKTAFRFHFHKTLQSMFYGVHYKGRHIVSIKDSK